VDRNFQRALPLVLKHEGGFSDHPKDPGGATNRGVTLATFRRYVKPDGTVAELKAITDAQIATVYYRGYWAEANAAALPSGVDYAVFDFAVNSGPARAVKFLQAVLGVAQDGRVGPKTIEAAQAADAGAVIARLCNDRLAWLKRLPTWATFGKGWGRRVADVQAAALAMVGNPADVEIVEKPVVPPNIEREVEKTERNGWLQWLAVIPLTTIGAFFKDYPEIAYPALGGVAVVAVVALIGGRRLVRRVKGIVAEVRA